MYTHSYQIVTEEQKGLEMFLLKLHRTAKVLPSLACCFTSPLGCSNPGGQLVQTDEQIPHPMWVHSGLLPWRPEQRLTETGTKTRTRTNSHSAPEQKTIHKLPITTKYTIRTRTRTLTGQLKQTSHDQNSS